MANGVNVKMGVSGVSQFKQNITTAQRSLKTMDAQLALVEKQFKATGDSEQYMQEKSQLLKAKLEEQKAVIEQSEKALAQMNANGVDKASKAAGKIGIISCWNSSGKNTGAGYHSLLQVCE